MEHFVAGTTARCVGLGIAFAGLFAQNSEKKRTRSS
jgi:hypothetical protein